MKVDTGTEAAQFPEKEYINGIFLAVYVYSTHWIIDVHNNVILFNGIVTGQLRMSVQRCHLIGLNYIIHRAYMVELFAQFRIF
jgi:hypothetical protein